MLRVGLTGGIACGKSHVLRRLAERGAPVFVTDAALLVESGIHLRFDRLVVVHCAPDEQLRRLRARDGLTEEAASARLLAQMPIEEKRGFGHWRLDTAGTVAETNAKADALAREVADVAASRPPTIELPPERALGLLVHGPQRGPRGLDP